MLNKKAVHFFEAFFKIRVIGGRVQGLWSGSLLFKFKELSYLLALTIRVQGNANSGLSSRLSRKDSKGLAKMRSWRVHL